MTKPIYAFMLLQRYVIYFKKTSILNVCNVMETYVPENKKISGNSI